MAPIIQTTTSSDEDVTLNPVPGSLAKDKLDLSWTDYHSTSPTPTLADGRENSLDAATAVEETRDGAPLDQQHLKSEHYSRSTSNLFADDDEGDRPRIRTSYLDAHEIHEDDYLPASPLDGHIPGLSLMASSSPNSLAGMEDISITPQTSMKPFFDETEYIQSQIDADAALARQLQEEEDSKKPIPSNKPKERVVPSMADSLFGEPLAWEVRANYTKVEDNGGEGGGVDLQNEITDSISDGISMLTDDFKRWGSSLTAAANDFFGEDLNMQVRSPKRRGASQYQNEI